MHSAKRALHLLAQEYEERRSGNPKTAELARHSPADAKFARQGNKGIGTSTLSHLEISFHRAYVHTSALGPGDQRRLHTSLCARTTAQKPFFANKGHDQTKQNHAGLELVAKTLLAKAHHCHRCCKKDTRHCLLRTSVSRLFSRGRRGSGVRVSNRLNVSYCDHCAICVITF